VIVKCDNCGQEFNKPANKIKISKHNYCSRQCMHRGIMKKNCRFCGSEDLIDFGWKKHPRVCNICWEHWKRERHKRSMICSKCGDQRSTKSPPVKSRLGEYLCPRCAHLGLTIVTKKTRISYKTCSCGRKFIVPFAKRTIKHCTPCLERKSCWDCGAELAKHRSHKSSNHPVCDQCMYERRVKYKTVSKVGKNNRDIAIKLIQVDALSAYGSKLAERSEIWKRKAIMGEKIFNSEP